MCVCAPFQLNKNISMSYSFCSLFCRYCKFSMKLCNIHDKAFTSIYALEFCNCSTRHSELFRVYISMMLALIAVCTSMFSRGIGLDYEFFLVFILTCIL